MLLALKFKVLERNYFAYFVDLIIVKFSTFELLLARKFKHLGKVFVASPMTKMTYTVQQLKFVI